MTTTVQLTDRLPEIIESTYDNVLDLLAAYFIDHGSEFPCLSNDLNYSGEVDSLIDSAVPIYTSDLRELAYFHHDAAVSALIDQFGSTDGDWPSGLFAAGLYCLIQEGVSELWDAEAADLWEAWSDAATPTNDGDEPNREQRQQAISDWRAQLRN